MTGISNDADSNVVALPSVVEAVELRHLRAFVAVATDLNFTRAAERLYISQPALSRQISILERRIGCLLINRSTHHVTLTMAGEALLARARTLLDDVEEAVHIAQAVGGELVGRVTRLLEPLATTYADDGIDIDDARRAFEDLHAQFTPPAEVRIRPVTANGVPSLICTPSSNDHLTRSRILFLHGGSFTLGSAYGYRHLAGALAEACDAEVLTADYRLAPEYPFPAALDDCEQAYRWLLERNDSEDVAIVGDSTGCGLVVGTLLRARQHGLPQPNSAVLMCPAVDPTWITHNPAVSSDAAQQMARSLRDRFTEPYLNGHPIDDPFVSPLHADLTGLPRLLVQAATGDTLRAHALHLVERAQQAGLDARLELYPTAVHDFHVFWSFLPEAADALQRAAHFLHAPQDKVVAGNG